jgi:transmembrane sensor
MNERSKAISDLIAKHLNDELNEQEKQELDKWVQQSEEHQRFFRQLTGEDSLAGTLAEYETSKAIVYDKIKEAIPFGKQPEKETIKTRWLNVRRLTAVAASILLIGAVYVWLNTNKNDKNVAETPVALVAQDKQPASEGAILKLADGKEIILDDANDGTVATQGNTQITKQGGLLLYKGNDSASQVLYNTLSTPKGRIYKLSLPDGSKVWLNAASSIRFPTAFTGWQRSVEITGEAYFEVKKDAQRPFRVTANQRAAIEVLGTSFNVNAYDNEEFLRTTLLTGSVRIQAWQQADGGNGVLLKPGQQAQLKSAHAVRSLDQSVAITVIDNANLQKVMGWKDGYFALDDLTLGELMHEVERWYDVEVVYEKGIPAKAFFGKVDRSLSLIDFMDGLKDWGVRFRLEGNKLIVTGVR